jgi:hypothetical protein
MANFSSDPSSWAHMLNLLVSSYGLCLFIWWWAKRGEASHVYMYVTILLFGEAMDAAIVIYAEYLRLFISDWTHDTFMQYSLLWPLRKVPSLIAISCIVVHMSFRAFYLNRKNKRRE